MTRNRTIAHRNAWVIFVNLSSLSKHQNRFNLEKPKILTFFVLPFVHCWSRSHPSIEWCPLQVLNAQRGWIGSDGVHYWLMIEYWFDPPEVECWMTSIAGWRFNLSLSGLFNDNRQLITDNWWRIEFNGK